MANPAIGLKSFTSVPLPIAGDLSLPASPPRRPSQPAKASGLSAFGLASNLFSKSSVSGYVPLTASTQFAIAQLMQGIETRKGLLVLTGEAGTGKTTVLNQLRTWLAEKSASTAFLFNPLLDTRNFFDFVLAEFGLRADPVAHGNSFTHLSNWLFARHREGALAVLIVDEAQALSPAVLQSLGCLLNLEVSGEKLLQIVLSGQPEFNDKLRAPDLRQFRQRIALRCRTSPLTAEETHSYIDDRLRAANANGKPLFSLEALDAIRFYSAGIPRVINLLCEHALANASRRQVQPVPPYLVEEIAHEFQLDDLLPRMHHRNPDFSDETNARMMRGSTIAVDLPVASVSPVPQLVTSDVGPSPSDLPVLADLREDLPLARETPVHNAPSSSNANVTTEASRQPHASIPGPQADVSPRHDRGWVKVYSGHSVLRPGRERLVARVVDPIQWLLSVAVDKTQQTWAAGWNRLERSLAKKSRPDPHQRSLLIDTVSSACRRAASSITHWLKAPIHASHARRTLGR